MSIQIFRVELTLVVLSANRMLKMKTANLLASVYSLIKLERKVFLKFHEFSRYLIRFILKTPMILYKRYKEMGWLSRPQFFRQIVNKGRLMFLWPL